MLNSILRSRANVFPSVLNYFKQKNSTAFSSHIRSSGIPTFTACRCFVSSLPEQLVDLDKEKRLKILMLEVDVLRQEGRKAPNPDLVKPDQWEHLLTLKSTSARRKYYSFLWQNEKKNESRIFKKLETQKKILEQKEQFKIDKAENEHLIYALSHNTFFLRLYDTTINQWNNNKLINAIQFGQKLIFDCSYDEHMNDREATNAAKQLMLCFAENRIHNNPFDLHYHNVNWKSTTMKCLQNYIPTLHEKWFPLNVSEKSYLDAFPKEKLVYLTPHCRNDLVEYNPDDIYIIGAMVDKINNEPLSLAKAKRLGLRMARLPLDRYLQWGSGSGKSLTLNQMLNILLELKDTGDWRKALTFVPKRKILDQDYRRSQDVRMAKQKTIAAKYKFDQYTWGNKDKFRKD